MRTLLVVLATAFVLGGCATRPGGMAQAQADPWENANRKVYAFNRGLDRVALKPATKVYRAVVPGAARRGVSNGLSNLDEPVSFFNALLQGKIKQAFRTVDRFLINTTLGVGGLADHATDLGRPEEPEDFGQTLAVWGVQSGPYLMLPLLGPSTLRDAVGFGVDVVSDPIPYFRDEYIANFRFTEQAGQLGLQTLDLRSRLTDAGSDGVLAGSLDEYATIRSAYLQSRQSDIYDGSPPDEEEEIEPLPAAPPAPTPEATATPIG